MSTVTSVDRAALEARVKHMYSEVAVNPHGDFHFEMGRGMAERLGYVPDDLDRCALIEQGLNPVRRRHGHHNLTACEKLARLVGIGPPYNMGRQFLKLAGSTLDIDGVKLVHGHPVG